MTVSPTKRELFWVSLFFGLLALALIAPISAHNLLRNLADYLNHIILIVQAKAALMEGQFPLRTVPAEASGWGYPLYQFYSPTSYTITGLIYQWLTPSNPLLAFKLTLWIFISIGGLYFYRLAYHLVQSSPAAILAGLVYLSSPFFILMLNRFGDMNEILGLGLLPVVLYYTIQRFYSPTKQIILLQASFAWYLLLTVHIVTFVYTSFFVALFLTMITISNHAYFKNLIGVGIAYALACLLAMWYLAPITLLSHFLVITHSFKLASTFAGFSVLISHLLFSGASINNHFISGLMELHPAVGWPILLGLGLTCYAYFNRQLSSISQTWAGPLLILFALAFFLAWSPIKIFHYLPEVFSAGQYTWRYLDQVIWIGALLFAIGLCWLFQNKLDARHLAVGVILLVSVNSAWFPEMNANTMAVSDFINHKNLLYGMDAYFLNFNDFPELVDEIDNMRMHAVMEGDRLNFNTLFIIPKILAKLAANPVIILNGTIANSTHDENYKLGLIVNDREVATYPLHKGQLNWEIPVTQFELIFPEASKYAVRFMLLKNHQEVKADWQVTVKQATLSGFLPMNETLTLQQTEPLCHRQDGDMVCHAFVPAGIKRLELPTLYYPDLLQITVNGKVTPYRSVLYLKDLLTTIQPQVGKVNDIRVKFRGLVWANWVSWCAWTGWGLVLLLTYNQLFLAIVRRCIQNIRRAPA